MIMFVLVLLLFSFALRARAASRCYVQDKGDDDVYRAARQDCIEVAKLMIHGDKAYAPMVFSRKEGVGFKVPHEWAFKEGTCFISINTVEEDDEVVYSVAKMARTVATIIHDCLDNPAFDKLGGKGECGPEQKISVTVAGKPAGLLAMSNTTANTTLS